MKILFQWALLIIICSVLFHFTSNEASKPDEITFSEFIHKVQLDEIAEVTFKNGGEISGKYLKVTHNTLVFTTIGDTANPEVFKILLTHNIIPNYDFTKNNQWSQIVIGLIPIALLFFLMMFMMSKASGTQNKLTSFGNNKAKLARFEGKVSFQDVAGNEEVKEDLKEIIDYLKNPSKYVRMGARAPKGVLMEGPPGTGKTLIAKATAGEAGVPFFSTSGSDFVEMFVGVGAARARDLFSNARANAPCIVFIDEIDAIGRKRGVSVSGHDEREQTLNQILVEMDGFNTTDGVIIMGATNRADVLDNALLRPGRFDRKVTFSNPDLASREAILKVHVKNKPIDSSVDLSIVARGTPGFSGADLENLVNEAILLAVRKKQHTVKIEQFEDSKDKILMGSERRTLKMTVEELRSTSFHESGHVIVNKLLTGLDPIHKVTIIPRGRSLGLTQTLPIDDRVSMSKDIAEKTISFLMGGRAAEDLMLGQFTSGASNDIERATDLAERMVCDWGMSELGAVHYKKRNSLVQQQMDYILENCYNVAKKLLSDNIEKLKLLSENLLQKETLTSKEIDDILNTIPG